MDRHIIVGVHIKDREKHAVKVQELFTKHGAQIRTRLGLHDEICPANGLVLLEMMDTPETAGMIASLLAMDGVESQQMQFAH